jgi:hypothetical protein
LLREDLLVPDPRKIEEEENDAAVAAVVVVAAPVSAAAECRWKDDDDDDDVVVGGAVGVGLRRCLGKRSTKWASSTTKRCHTTR